VVTRDGRQGYGSVGASRMSRFYWCDLHVAGLFR
jgi:hypothetical protein